MGLASPIVDALGKNPPLRRVVEAVRDIALVLAVMHERAVFHRDIKPENLFLYQGRWSVGDFGLAEFAGKTSETAEGERLGPIHYIAPEMLNDAPRALGGPADVYSLSKTLWVLATGQRFPQPGVYVSSHPAFQLASYVLERGLRTLDRLIEAATTVSPEERPSMKQVVSELSAWLHPPAAQQVGLRLDIAQFAAELETAKLQMETERERQRSVAAWEQAARDRIALRLRPLVGELSEALTEAHFGVTVHISNIQSGFQLLATVPSNEEHPMLLALRIDVFADGSNHFRIRCVFDAQRRGLLGTVCLWDKEARFLEGGPDEDAQIVKLEGALRREIQHCATAVLQMRATMPQDNPRRGAHPLYELAITNDIGVSIDADAVLIGSNGGYVRFGSLSGGRISAGNVALSNNITLLAAHKDYVAVIEPNFAGTNELAMRRVEGVGSIIFTRGWTFVDGIAGQICVTVDSVGRLSLFGDDVIVDDGQDQPMLVSVGHPVVLEDSLGSRRALTLRFVVGACILAEVARLPNRQDWREVVQRGRRR